MTKEIDCSTCGETFSPVGRQKRCPRCRFRHERKTSMCPYCSGVYDSHGGNTRSETTERMIHFTGKCRS